MRIIGRILTAALLPVLISCQKENQDGVVSFALEEGEVFSCTKSSVSDFAAVPSVEEFNLLIKNASTGSVIYNGKFTGWKEDTKVRSGNYTAEASCGIESEEGPDKPFFYGCEEFQITGGQNTEVGIPVSLGNCIVRIECSESFRQYYPDYSFRIETPYNPEGFDYDGRAVFVACQFSVSGQVTDRNGVQSQLKKSSWSGAPATSYTVEYDISNVGGATVVVTFDNTLYPVDTGGIDLKEDE